MVKCGVLTASMDLFCFCGERLLPERYEFCDIWVKTISFLVLKVCFLMFELFKPDFEAILLLVRGIPLVLAISKR